MSWSQPAFESLACLVAARTGLNLASRSDSAESGMRRAMARAKVADPGRYVELVAADQHALDDLTSELTVGETYFFREPGHFKLIRRDVLPDLRRRHGPERVLRAWSAGCASGEEAYSLAILFAEEGGDPSHVLATDISHQALAKARQALFGEWSLRGEQGRDALPYLRPVGKRYKLDDAIRRRVTFAPLNLALDVYPSLISGAWGMDLILCRNVLIYFERATVHDVAQRLYQTLNDGGWLITASSDPPLWEEAPFEVVTRDEGIFYRRASVADRVDEEVARPRERPAPALAPDETGQPTITDDLRAVRASPAGVGQEEAIAPSDLLEEARQALVRGEYSRVLQVTAERMTDPASLALRLRALANLDLAEAVAACARAAAEHPLAQELSYLHAVLLLNLGRDEEAVRALRRVLYLDRSLASAHFLLGSMLQRRGDRSGARRAYRNVRALCVRRPADEIVPLADGERAGRLAELADAELGLLDPDRGDA